MRRKGVLALALALAVTLVIGVAVAVAAKSYSTKINYLGNDGPSVQDLTFFGSLSTNSKCLTGRKVLLYKRTSNDSAKLIDADISSFNGAWAVRANLTGTPDIAIKVRKETRNHGNVICKGSAITILGNKAKYSEVG